MRERLAKLKIDFGFLRIDRDGLFIFGYRFASQMMLERIDSEPPEVDALYHKFRFLRWTVYKRK